jgi:hypothetical protein
MCQRSVRTCPACGTHPRGSPARRSATPASPSRRSTQVNNDFVTWTGSNGVTHDGVEAHQVNGGTAVRGGDSGGLVFALLSGNVRQARGINSFGGGTLLRWTEAPFIFSTFSMSLAP